jgi:RNA polymerase sigma-70 factor, ECF subfamily
MVAEDIVSDSLVKLWEKMKKENITVISPLLFTILKHSALDYLKHESVKHAANRNISEFLIRDLELRLSTLQSSDPQEIFSNEVKQIIHNTLYSLPEKTRRIFEMSRFEGKHYYEIAEYFGMTVKGVDYHILRTIKELHIALKDYLPICLFFSYLF